MSTRNAPANGVRADIQALRAFAVMAVVLFHLWPIHMPGGYIGVDAFFAISGFLITAHLLRETDRTGTVDLPKFWARRVRRLLPASLLVIIVSAVGVLLLLPRGAWQTFLSDSVAATFYFLNWSLAAQAVDYLAAENAASPVQHYWSLSVEEQFYLVWPLLIVASLWFARRTGRTGRASIFLVLALVTAASLAYGIVLTSLDPASAYFVTPTRAWQFGAGALLAFIPVTLARHRPLSAATAWAGIAMLVVSAFAYGATTPFPGVAALLPIAGVLLVVLAGESEHPLAPTRFYELRPVQWLGDYSYSIYLWHWPPIVILPYVVGTLSWPHKILILAGTLFLAWLTKKYVEDPFRASSYLRARKPRVTFAALAGATAVAVAAPGIGLSSLAAQERADEQVVAQAINDPCFGAAAIQDNGILCTPDIDKVVPEPEVAPDDLPPVYGDRCRVQPEAEGVKECTLGDDDGAVRLALVGDSHVAQWATPLDAIGKERGWDITLYFKGACPFSTAVAALEDTFDRATCITWNEEVLRRILESGYDGVITSSRAGYNFAGSDGDRDRGVAVGGYRQRWEQLTAAGLPVAVLVDTPVMPTAARECVTTPDESADCGVSIDVAFEQPEYLTAAARDTSGVTLVNLTDRFCTDSFCPAVVGSVYVYRDSSSHVTDTFATTLEPWLEEQIQPFAAAIQRSGR
ncbi:acyltransferase family protein [Myceligenerans halotolerans]